MGSNPEAQMLISVPIPRNYASSAPVTLAQVLESIILSCPVWMYQGLQTIAHCCLFVVSFNNSTELYTLPSTQITYLTIQCF